MTQRDWSQTSERQLQKEIGGILRCVIDAHGPITSDKIGSASKRLVAHMKAKGYWRDGGDDVVAGPDNAAGAVVDAGAADHSLGEYAQRVEHAESRAKVPGRPASTLRSALVGLLGGQAPHNPRDSHSEPADREAA
jgi:hypothetical protein